VQKDKLLKGIKLLRRYGSDGEDLHCINEDLEASKNLKKKKRKN